MAEPIYFIKKEDFIQSLMKNLENVTHVAVLPERNEQYGFHNQDFNAFSIVAVACNSVSAGGLWQILPDLLKPVEGGFEPYCADAAFMEEVARKVEEHKTAQKEMDGFVNTHMAEVAETLRSPNVPESAKVEATLGIIMDAIQSHEQKKAER